MKNIFLTILTLAVFSCSTKEKKPENLLSQPEMVSLLIDIHILESQVQLLRLPKDTSQLLFNTFEKEVFEKHNIDKEVYTRSFEYYLDNVKQMDKIYAAVIDSLNYREKSVDKDGRYHDLPTGGDKL